MFGEASTSERDNFPPFLLPAKKLAKKMSQFQHSSASIGYDRYDENKNYSQEDSQQYRGPTPEFSQQHLYQNKNEPIIFAEDNINLLIIQLCQEMKISYNESLINRAKLLFQKGNSLSQVLEFGVSFYCITTHHLFTVKPTGILGILLSHSCLAIGKQGRRQIHRRV